MTHHAVDLLRRLRDVCRQQNDKMLREAADDIDDFLEGDIDDIRHVFHLETARGERKPTTKARQDDRNDMLREMAAEHFSTLKPAEQGRAVHKALTRYERAAWKNEAHLSVCPPRHVGTVNEYAWRILCLDRHVLSADRIARTLRAKTGTSSPSRARAKELCSPQRKDM